MIYVVTVHWKDACWLGAQIKRLKKHMGEEYKLFGNCPGLEPEWCEAFDWCAYEDQKADTTDTNPANLNFVTREVLKVADDEDLLVFLDGDCFPIVNNFGQRCRDLLKNHPLAAVRRLENLGDMAPHPSFCVTTVGTWRLIKGNWKISNWRTWDGLPMRDVGSFLGMQLCANELEWKPIHRTNNVDLDPVYFALYGGIVYHHGAGYCMRNHRCSRRTKRGEVALKKVGTLSQVIQNLARQRDDFHKLFVNGKYIQFVMGELNKFGIEVYG